MKQELVTVRNLVTGKVGKVRRRIAEHPVFGDNLEIVDATAKDQIPLTELVDKKRKTSKPQEESEPLPVEEEKEEK